MKVLLLIICIVSLAGCSSRYQYNPSSVKGSGPYHTQVGDNLFRVHYKLLKDDQEKARNLALQHAASLTRSHQLDWFVVLTEQLVTEQLNSADSDSVVRLTCDQDKCHQSSYDAPYFRQQFPKNANKVTTEVILQIRMGKGVRPDSRQSFDTYSEFQQ